MMPWGGRVIVRQGDGQGGGSGTIEGVTAGAGLTGGGTTGTVTLNIAVNADGGLIATANEIQLGALGYARVQTALAAANAALSLNSQTISDVADPVAPQDVATRAFVEALLSGISWKTSVRAATTANITLSGTQTIDGVSVLAGYRVLVKDQTDDTQNGLYVAAAGAWSRSTDADTGAEFQGGIAVWVTEGTANGSTGWVAVTSGTVTLGVTSIVFSQFAGVTQLIAGAGLTQTGSTLDVVANGDGSIVVNANDLQVGVLASDGQHGSRGGGTTHAEATTSVAGFLSAADKTKLDGLPSSAVATTTQVIAGTGLTGGGALSGNVTLNVIANADGSIVANANDVQVGVLASDAQHGVRGGGTQHATAVASGAAGFMSGSDKAKLDGLPGACSTTIWVADGAATSTYANGRRYFVLPHSGDDITWQFTSARTGTLQVKIRYAMSSSESANVRLRLDSLVTGAGGNPAASIVAGTAFTLATSNDVLSHDLTSSNSSDFAIAVSEGDDVLLTLNRLASGDTHTGDMRFSIRVV